MLNMLILQEVYQVESASRLSLSYQVCRSIIFVPRSSLEQVLRNKEVPFNYTRCDRQRVFASSCVIGALQAYGYYLQRWYNYVTIAL